MHSKILLRSDNIDFDFMYSYHVMASLLFSQTRQLSIAS